MAQSGFAKRFAQQLIDSDASAPSSGTFDEPGHRVIDGDTYARQDGSRVRTIGGDAPELQRPGQPHEPGASTAKRWLQKHLPEVSEEIDHGQDVYGRDRRELRRDGENVMHQMVRSGLAVPEIGDEEGTRSFAQNFAARVMGRDTEWDQMREAEAEQHPDNVVGFSPASDATYYDRRGTFGRSVERGVDQLRGITGAAADFVGQQTGIDAMSEWGEDLMMDAMLDVQLNPREVESFRDIGQIENAWSDTGTWLLQTLGENAPNLLAMAGGAVAGAGVGGVAAGTASAIGKQYGKQLFTKEARRKMIQGGAATGAFSGVYPQHLGQYAMELNEGNVDLSEADDVWLWAVANSLLDTAGAAFILNRVFGGLSTGAARDLVRENAQRAAEHGLGRRLLGVAGEAGRAGGAAAAVEAPIEAFHELMYMTARQYHDPDYSIDFSDQATQDRLIEGALAGATVGGALAGGGRATTGTLREVFSQHMVPGEEGGVIRDGGLDISDIADRADAPTGGAPLTPGRTGVAPAGATTQRTGQAAEPESPGTVEPEGEEVGFFGEAPAATTEPVGEDVGFFDTASTEQPVTEGAPEPDTTIDETAPEVYTATNVTEAEIGAEGEGMSIPSAEQLQMEPVLIPLTRSSDGTTYSDKARDDAARNVKRMMRLVTGSVPGDAPITITTSRLNEGIQVDGNLPPQEFRPDAASPSAIAHLARAAATGSVKRDNRIEVRAPVADDGSMLNMRLDAPELTRFGATLNQIDTSQMSASDARRAFTTALAYLQDQLGARPRDRDASRADWGLPRNLVIADRGDGRQVRLGDVTGQARQRGPRKQPEFALRSDDDPITLREQARTLGDEARHWYQTATAAQIRQAVDVIHENGILTDDDAQEFSKPRSRPDADPTQHRDTRRSRRAAEFGRVLRERLEAPLEDRTDTTPVFDRREGFRPDETAPLDPTEDTRGAMTDAIGQQEDTFVPGGDTTTDNADSGTTETAADGGVVDTEARQLQRTHDRRGDMSAAAAPARRPHDPVAPREETLSAAPTSPYGPLGDVTTEGAPLSTKTQELQTGINQMLTELGLNLRMPPVVIGNGESITSVANQLAEQGLLNEGSRNRAMMEKLYLDDPVGRVVFLRDNFDRVRPLIYLSDQATTRAQHNAALHETGHVVLREYLQTATPEQLNALTDILGNLGKEADRTRFEENFAKLFVRWNDGIIGAVDARNPAERRMRDVLQNFFGELWRTMRRFYRRFRSRYRVDPRFSDFMEGLVNRRRRNMDEAPQRPNTEHGRRMHDMLENNGVIGNGLLRFDPAWADSLNYGVPVERRAAHERGAYRKAEEWFQHGRKRGENILGMMNHVWSHWLRNADQVLRKDMIDPTTGRTNRVVRNFANEFRKLPGIQELVSGITVTHKSRQLQEKFQRQLNQIAAPHMARARWRDLFTGNVPEPSETAQQAFESMIEGRTPPTREAQELADSLRDVFSEAYNEARNMGMDMGFQRNYVPVAYDAQRAHNLGRDWFLERVQQWRQDNPQEAAEFQRRFLAHGVTNLTGRLSQEQRTARAQQPEQNMTEMEAQALGDYLYNVLTFGDGVFNDPNADSPFAGDPVAPGFQYRKSRQLPNSLHQYLTDARERNLVKVASAYTRKLMERAAFQERFGMREEIDGIQRRYERARNLNDAVGRNRRGDAEAFVTDNPAYRDLYEDVARVHQEEGLGRPTTGDMVGRAFEAAQDYRDERVDFFNDRYGVNIYDPLAKLKVDLKEEALQGRLRQEDLDRILNEIIPSYTGTFGANTHPGWRRVQQALMVYQGIRVLSLGFFAQIVDLALIASRTAPGYRLDEITGLVRDMARESGSNAQGHATGYKGMQETARILGLWQDDVMNHVMNDNMGMLAMGDRMSLANNLFFKYNGMHFATNFARMASSNLAARLFESYHRDGRADLLAELNLTPEEVQAWLDDGKPLEIGKGHDNVIGGIHQFTDESVIFPNPAIRPRLGNDRRTAVFWHLKSFMWGYHAQVLERVWNQMQQKWGEEQGARKMQAAMPMIMLASFSLPLAMLGMELRWLISDPNRRPASGSPAYFFEAAQRSGMTGYPQLVIDADAAENYGRTGFMAVLGPSASHAEEIITGGFPPTQGTVERSLPAYPIVNRIREAMQ